MGKVEYSWLALVKTPEIVDGRNVSLVCRIVEPVEFVDGNPWGIRMGVAPHEDASEYQALNPDERETLLQVSVWGDISSAGMVNLEDRRKEGRSIPLEGIFTYDTDPNSHYFGAVICTPEGDL